MDMTVWLTGASRISIWQHLVSTDNGTVSNQQDLIQLVSLRN